MNLAKINLILAVAAAGLALPTAMVLRHEATIWHAVGVQPKLFEGFLADRVQRVTIAQPRALKAGEPAPKPTEPKPGEQKKIDRDVLSFMRNDKKWVLAQGEIQGKPIEIAGAPISATMVENELLKRLGDIRLDKETLVLKDASDAALADYNLTEEKAFVVQCLDGNGQPIVQLFVGKDAASGKASAESVRGYFVRSVDSHDVVLYEPTPNGFWNHSIDVPLWLDKKVQQIEAAKVVRFTLKNEASNGVEIVVERKPGESLWKATQQPPETGAVHQTEIETMVQRFQYVIAQDFRAPLAKATLPAIGLQPPKTEISATVKDGDKEQTYKLAIGDKVEDKNEVYILSSESQFLMTWAAHMPTVFQKNLKDLFDPPADVLAPKDGDKKDGDKKEPEKKDEAKTPADKPADAGKKEGDAPKEGDKPPEKKEGDAPKDGDKPAEKAKEGEKPKVDDRAKEGEKPKEGDKPKGGEEGEKKTGEAGKGGS